MLPTPRGPFSCGEESIATSLIGCGWFAKFTKEDISLLSQGQAAALLRTRIHFDKIPNPTTDGEVISFPDLESQRPFVCLWPAQPAGRVAWKAGTHSVAVGLDYQIYFEASEDDAILDDPAIDDTKGNELFRWWLNMIGVLLVGDSTLDVAGLIHQPDIAIQRISNVDIWHTTESRGLGKFFSAIVSCELGTSQT